MLVKITLVVLKVMVGIYVITYISLHKLFRGHACYLLNNFEKWSNHLILFQCDVTCFGNFIKRRSFIWLEILKIRCCLKNFVVSRRKHKATIKNPRSSYIVYHIFSSYTHYIFLLVPFLCVFSSLYYWLLSWYKHRMSLFFHRSTWSIISYIVFLS